MESKVCLCAAIVLVISQMVMSAGKWGYTGKAGPDSWHEQFKKCAGKRQSPIDIKAEESMYDPSLRNFGIWYDPPRPDSNITVKNNGHTLQVDLEGDFYVSNGGLKHIYKAAQFHFHWGGKVHHGSEHLMEGKASPIEMHLVTYNSEKYDHIGLAATETDGLAVLGTMFEVSKEDNPAFDSIIKAIEFIRDPHDNRNIRLPVESVSIRDILPLDISHYFRYQGSLTTPHCHESVIWTVFEQKQTISEAQLNEFRTLLKSGHHHRKVKKEEGDKADLSRRRRSVSRRHSHLGKRERDVLVELGIKGNREEETYLKEATQALKEREMYQEMGMFADQPADARHNQVGGKQDPLGDPKAEVKMDDDQWFIINNYRPVQPLHGRVVYRSFKLREPPVGTARSDQQRVSYATLNEEDAPPCDGATAAWASLLVLLASLLMAVLLVV